MSIRQNKARMLGGGICAAILVVELAWLGFSAFRFSGVSKDLKIQERRLLRLRTRNPFPSTQNKQVLEENLDELAFRVSELEAELNRDPTPRHVVEPAELSAFIQTQVERFERSAVQAGVELPDTLEAGFSQYASGGAVAVADDVPRLMRQLHSVRAVGDVLVDAGVASIDEVTRDLFEGEARRPNARHRRSDRLSGTRESGTEKPIASEIGPAGLYLIERIGITFRAEEQAVWAALQGMASAPQFMVLREFSHRTVSNILTYSPRLITRGAEADDETLHFLQGGILRGKNALSRPERIIAGNELVQVQLIVDVYHFNAEESDDRSW